MEKAGRRGTEWARRLGLEAARPSGRQLLEESGVEDGDVGTSGMSFARHVDAL